MSRARQRANDRTLSGLDSVSMGAEHIQTPDGAPVNGRSNVLMDGTHPFHVLVFERIFGVYCTKPATLGVFAVGIIGVLSNSMASR